MDAQTLFDGCDVGSVSTLLHGTLRLIEWIDVTTWTQCLIARRPIPSHTIRQICIRCNCFFGIDNVSAIFYDGNVPSSQMVRKYGESSCILSHKQEDVCTTSLFITGVKVLDINFLGLSHGKKVFIITVQSHHLVLHQLCRLVCLVRCEVNGASSAFDWSQFIPYIGIIIGHTTTPWGALVHVLRSSAYTRPTDTLPLNMHSCRCSNHDGGDFPWSVSSNLEGRNEQTRAASYELEIACGYCYDQLLNNGIDSPYKSSRDRKEYSDVISSGYYWDASALMVKSSSTYYADTQVYMYAMHNFHLMHHVRPQDHGEPMGCTFKSTRKSVDYIVKSRKYGERIVCTITSQHSLLHRDVAIHIIATLIEPITETSSSVDNNLNSYVETIDVKAYEIGDYDVNVDNNITNGVGKPYTNDAVDWGAVFEPITNIYGNYCAAWKTQRKSSPPMHDTSVTAYASSYASTYASSSLYAINQRSLLESLRLLLTWMQPFEMSLCEDNRRSIDSDAVYAWTTSETSKDDLAVEVEGHGLTVDTNMSSCASLVNGEHLLRGMIKETGTNSTDRSLLLGVHLMQQLMMRRFDYLAHASMQPLINLAQSCLSHEHHVIMVAFCIILHALIAPIIVPVTPYEASTTATKLKLQAYGMRKDITPPDGHNSTSSSTPIGGYDTVDDGIIPNSTVVEEHPTSIEAERSYEGINLSGPRTRCVLTDDVFTGGLNIPTVDLHSCILSQIKNLRSYLGLLSSECMPQHLNELCRNDPTPSERTHDATIVNFISDTRSKNATYTNHFVLPYNFALENISSGTLRFNTMAKYLTFLWLILQHVLFLKRGKLKLTSTTGDTTISYGHQTFGRLMGSHGPQYHINRTNGTNRRGVTNECRPHVDTDSISTIDASTFREYWYSKSNHISRWCSQGI